MGLGGINVTQLLIILAIVILIFGTKRLKTLGGDLGGALKGFRKAMDNDEDSSSDDSSSDSTKQLGGSKEAPDAEFSEQGEKQKES